MRSKRRANFNTDSQPISQAIYYHCPRLIGRRSSRPWRSANGILIVRDVSILRATHPGWDQFRRLQRAIQSRQPAALSTVVEGDAHKSDIKVLDRPAVVALSLIGRTTRLSSRCPRSSNALRVAAPSADRRVDAPRLPMPLSEGVSLKSPRRRSAFSQTLFFSAFFNSEQNRPLPGRAGNLNARSGLLERHGGSRQVHPVRARIRDWGELTIYG